MGARAQGSNREAGTKPAIGDGVSFGPFRLHVTQRRLEKNGIPVPLGARAFDILVALIERAGTVVSKTDLMARAWPHTTVDESALRVQVVALRKLLGEGDAGARYLTTVSGQGYCLRRYDRAPRPLPVVMYRTPRCARDLVRSWPSSRSTP